MATMNSTIEYIDQLKDNVYTAEDKFAWIARLDGLVSIEVLQQEEPVQYEIPGDADKDLLVPAPFDDIYALYVAAMIDFYNKEYANYNNSVLMFSERLDQFKTWHIRRNRPASARNFRNVMG